MRLPNSGFIKLLMLAFLMTNLLFFGALLLNTLLSYEEIQILKGIMLILAIPLAIIIPYLLKQYSKTRKATSHLKQKPKPLLGFITNQSPQKIIEQVTLIASTFNYTIEDIDESIGRIILGSSPNWISWGFFYPVYVSNQNEGKTYVEIGIKSRLYQSGPLVTRDHKKFYNRVKNTITNNVELKKIQDK